MRAYGLTVLRVFVAAVFILHGVEKLFGFRGGGMADTAAAVARLRLPAGYPLAVGAAAGELACGILLLVGGFTLWVAIALLVARVAVFYQGYAAAGAVVPSARAPRTEFELSLVLIGALLAIVLAGPGALSLDDRRRRSERAAAGRGRTGVGKL